MFGRQTESFESRDSIGSIWGYRTPYRGEGQWPTRIDEHLLEDPERWVQSACVLCSNGCGLDIGVRDGRMVGVRGRSEDRVSRGRLGPKGLHGWVANASSARLTRPLIRADERLHEATWQEAMRVIVGRSKELRDRYSSLAIAFYTGGQLFLEEYYTLAVIGKGGLGTPHMDASTRLSSATASAALIESFGSDGPPGSYADIDTTEAILHLGHNVASQQTVLWTRILDRRHGPRPPGLVVIDPRETWTAQEADVHLVPRPGTNLAVMNGLLNLIIQSGWVDRGYIDAHTVGFARLKETAARWPPDRVEGMTGVPVDDLRAAAQILGTAPTLVSTVLQGVYQSKQATAAAVQVNNLHLIRGLIGRPGCGILQMNGQPAGQNVAETGCAGSLPAFRNWANPQHIAELAHLWNVDPQVIPAWGPPTHIMQIMRHIELGSIKMLWVIGTNPAMSLPDLLRIRRILSSEGLFLVVQDAFLTETTELADVVLPAAIWGEKTGTYTSADRTVHISHTAVSPPGQARPDLEILLEYAEMMDLRDHDGDPLIKWRDPEGAFEAWKECSRGRPCDYTGLSYARLSDSPGIQWPCGQECSAGTSRLYVGGLFNTDAGYAQSYGHDLLTGSALTAADYCLHNPCGRAVLKAAEHVPSLEEPDEAYPLWLTTGRVVYQWQTRTKTGHCEKLNRAAPDAFVQISEEDAGKYGIREGQMVEVRSRRGYALAPARLGGIEPGVVFMPFHYGYWDDPGRHRAANELTLSEWDPVSKQPHLKYAAVRIRGIPRPTLADRARRRLQRFVAWARGILSTGGTGRVRFQIRGPVAGE